MMVIGLTGGIGMGKSTVASMFARLGVPAFSADAAVRVLQAPGGKAIPALAQGFPGSVVNGVLNRAKLRGQVLGDAPARRRLEAIMHPLVRREEALFSRRALRDGRRAVVLDIPLLFETGAERRVDKTVTVSAPRDVQIARLKRRGNLSAAEIDALIALQMPDGEKRARADYVIPTGLSRFHTWLAVRRLLQRLLP